MTKPCTKCGRELPATAEYFGPLAKTPVGSEYHVDHVIPLVQGGSNGPENLVISCPLCNVSKGGRLPQEFGNRLC